MLRSRLWIAMVLACSGCHDPVVTGGIIEPGPIRTADQFIQALTESYRNRDLTLFASLLAHDADSGAEFHFISADGLMRWDHQTMVDLHQRLFEPQNTLPGQSPVPADLWLTSISITLTQNTPFEATLDFYESVQNPTGLDPQRWKAASAIYTTYVLFDTQGDLDFLVEGRARFVVIEDLSRKVGDLGRFLILQWEELAKETPMVSSVEPRLWSEVLALYK